MSVRLQWRRSRCIDALCFCRDKKPCRYIGRTTTNVGITTRGRFIIPANDLTKRTRRPGMGRVESRSPLSRGRPSSLSPSFFPERSYSPIYIPRCNLRWPRCAVRASIYTINHSKRPSTTAIGDTAIYRVSGVQLPLEEMREINANVRESSLETFLEWNWTQKIYIKQVFTL